MRARPRAAGARAPNIPNKPSRRQSRRPSPETRERPRPEWECREAAGCRRSRVRRRDRWRPERGGRPRRAATADGPADRRAGRYARPAARARAAGPGGRGARGQADYATEINGEIFRTLFFAPLRPRISNLTHKLCFPHGDTPSSTAYSIVPRRVRAHTRGLPGHIR